MGLFNRIKNGWNAFVGRDPKKVYQYGSYSRPDRIRLNRGHERSIISSVYTRIAIDCASITIEHARLDSNGRYSEVLDTGLNQCLNLSANIDQTGRAFIQNTVFSMLNDGVTAIVIVDANTDPSYTESYRIGSMRCGPVTEWYPDAVKVKLYNDTTGRMEEITVPKSICAIVENPFYAVMNEPNSTAQRLIRKLNMLDAIDEQSSSGKLDLIIQLPYVIKSQARRDQAELRRKEIEMQLAGSKYGIAYTDGTEKITQLNRAVENNLLTQVQYLTELLFSQLGVPIEVFNGKADEQMMLNYHNRTIEPIVSALVNEMKRKFISKTALSQGQSLVFFKDPFRLVPSSQMAEIADKYIRNEIMSANEMRQVIGMKPSSDAKADELRNPNIQDKSADNEAIDNLIEQ